MKNCRQIRKKLVRKGNYLLTWTLKATVLVEVKMWIEQTLLYRLEEVMGEDLPAKVVVLALASVSSGWSMIMMVMVMVVDGKNPGKPPTRRLCRSSGQNLALESASGNWCRWRSVYQSTSIILLLLRDNSSKYTMQGSTREKVYNEEKVGHRPSWSFGSKYNWILRPSDQRSASSLPPGSPSSQTVHRTLLLEETGCRQSGTVEHENKLEVNFYSTTQHTAYKAENWIYKCVTRYNQAHHSHEMII